MYQSAFSGPGSEFFAAARAVVAGIEFVGDLRRVVQGGVYAVIACRGLDVVAVLRKASVRAAEVYRPVVVRAEFEFPGAQCDVDPETLFLVSKFISVSVSQPPGVASPIIPIELNDSLLLNVNVERSNTKR